MYKTDTKNEAKIENFSIRNIGRAITKWKLYKMKIWPFRCTNNMITIAIACQSDRDSTELVRNLARELSKEKNFSRPQILGIIYISGSRSEILI